MIVASLVTPIPSRFKTTQSINGQDPLTPNQRPIKSLLISKNPNPSSPNPQISSSPMSTSAADHDDETHESPAAEDEDTGAQIAPIVTLTEVAVTTGEEDEDPLLDLKSKLYRFDKDGQQWKERGTGNVKLLKHKESGKVRLVMRQSKTLKICANHIVGASIKVQEHAGNDKSCVWHAVDFADGELKEEMFCMRFGSVENCKKFMEMVDSIVESLGKNEEKADKDTSETAGLLEKLSVDESKAEKNKDEASASTEEKEDKPETDKS